MNNVQGKFRVVEVKLIPPRYEGSLVEPQHLVRVKLVAIKHPDFGRERPQGNIEMFMVNPEAIAYFPLESEHYVTFERATDSEQEA